MPYTITFDQDNNCLFFEASDTFTGADIINSTLEIVEHPNFTEGLNLLADLRPIKQLDVSAADIRRLIELYRKLHGRLGYGQYALVTNSQVIYGMSRMYQIMAERMPFVVEVFREKEVALRWLGLSDGL